MRGLWIIAIGLALTAILLAISAMLQVAGSTTPTP